MMEEEDVDYSRDEEHDEQPNVVKDWCELLTQMTKMKLRQELMP